MPWVEKRVAAGGKPRCVALYRDPTGAKRSAGTFPSKVLATRAAYDAARTIKHSTWIDPKDGKTTFTDYVEQAWWPSRHLEVSTAAAYRSNLDHHLIPYFGTYPIEAILPSTVQAWVSHALAGGLSPRSVRKYHTLLHGIFARAVRDRVLLSNPAAHTELPKVITRRLRVLTPTSSTGCSLTSPPNTAPWCCSPPKPDCAGANSSPCAPPPRHCRSDADRAGGLRRSLQEELPQRAADDPAALPHRQRTPNPAHHHPAQRRPRSTHQDLRPRPGPAAVRQPGRAAHLPLDLPRPRMATAIEATVLDFHLRWHDLRHTNASWLLASGADLKTVMDRLGHSQLTTTQQYLHTLPNTDDTALAALARVRER
jgi:integrase